MAVSLEARVPLLDHELIEFVARIPARLKMKGSETKHIFKRAVRGLVPDEILDRPKQGFGVPIQQWINQQLRGRIRETLLDRAHARARLLRAALRRACCSTSTSAGGATTRRRSGRSSCSNSGTENLWRGRRRGPKRVSGATSPSSADPSQGGVFCMKVLLVEINEITWDLIDPLIEQGKLPTFARLKREGA